MNKRLLVIPYLLLGLSSIAQLLSEPLASFEPLNWLSLVSLLACLLCIPVISKHSLRLGYAALLFPFAVLVLSWVFASEPSYSITVESSGELKWNKDAVSLDEFLDRLEERQKELEEESNQPVETTAAPLPFSSDATPADSRLTYTQTQPRFI